VIGPTFLSVDDVLNGVEMARDDQRLDDALLAVAIGTLTKEGAAQVLREVAEPRR
jgi:prophage maintenance system killer protein